MSRQGNVYRERGKVFSYSRFFLGMLLGLSLIFCLPAGLLFYTAQSFKDLSHLAVPEWLLIAGHLILIIVFDVGFLLLVVRYPFFRQMALVLVASSVVFCLGLWGVLTFKSFVSHFNTVFVPEGLSVATPVVRPPPDPPMKPIKPTQNSQEIHGSAKRGHLIIFASINLENNMATIQAENESQDTSYRILITSRNGITCQAESKYFFVETAELGDDYWVEVLPGQEIEESFSFETIPSLSGDTVLHLQKILAITGAQSEYLTLSIVMGQ